MKPASLGDDDKVEYTTVFETFPVPAGGRKPLLASIESILANGGVQKLIVELNQPIKVRRSVPKGTVLEEDTLGEIPDQLLIDDIYGAARNAEMRDFSMLSPKPFQLLFGAFEELDRNKLRARAVMVRQRQQLIEWLSTPMGKNTRLFGVEIIESKHIPDETLLLVGADRDDETKITLSLRLEMDVPSVKTIIKNDVKRMLEHEAADGKDVEQWTAGQSNGKDSGAVVPIARGVNGQDKGGRT